MELVSFNNAFLTMFPKNKDKDLIYIRCGEAIGCAYQAEEQKDCGRTKRLWKNQ